MQATGKPRTNVGIVALLSAALLLFAGLGASSAEAAKGGKIKTCAAKKGPDKGLLRLSKAKCKKGEKKVVFYKKGPKGETGPAGPAGPAGQPGTNGSNQELVTTVETLENQLATLTTQFGTVAPQVGALCSQLTLVTDQTDLLGGVLVAVNNLLDPLTAGTLPTVPAVLGSFSCPS